MVISAATTLVDEVGVAGFTMRQLSERLGVQAPTIYWHVGSKAALFEAVVDRGVTEMADLATVPGDWEHRLRMFLAAASESLLAHPGVLELMRSVHSHALERWSAVALDIMRDAGFVEDAAYTYARVALSNAMGAAHFEADVRATPYLEPVPGSKRRRYRVKPAVLRAGIDPGFARITIVDLDEERRINEEIFVDGVRAAATRSLSTRKR
jgi:AcrR family transcriptional regulator